MSDNPQDRENDQSGSTPPPPPQQPEKVPPFKPDLELITYMERSQKPRETKKA